MFLLNSCLSLFSATRSPWHSFSRSYGVILPSSLTMLLPPALGFSPHPPVSVYGTGIYGTIVAFLDSSLRCFPTSFRSALRHRFFLPRLICSTCVPTCSDHIWCRNINLLSIDYALRLALGPDFPRADQLYPGILGYSAWTILTSISLLIPAFSLHSTPPLLIGTVSTPL